MAEPLLRVSDLQTVYTAFGGQRVVRAVDGVSLTIARGESLGLVGESGSGKTTTCLSIVRLLPRGAHIDGGNVEFGGQDLLRLSTADMNRVRGRRIAMILQDPMASLNPLLTIYDQVAEPAYFHRAVRGGALKSHVTSLLRAVRIPSPEPTTNLDVTIQAQYLNMLKDVQRRTGVALLFVTHNLGIVAKMCDRVAVMYAGRIVEQGPVRELFASPRHPYTQALLQSIPKIGSKEPLDAIPGQPPDLANLPTGCSFHPRCPHAWDRCRVEEPADLVVAADHRARCWLLDGRSSQLQIHVSQRAP